MQNEIQISIRKLERLCSFENLRRDLEQEFLNSDLDFVLGPDDHFESHLLGNGMYLDSDVCYSLLLQSGIRFSEEFVVRFHSGLKNSL